MVQDSAFMQAQPTLLRILPPVPLPLTRLMITPCAADEPAVYWYGGAGRSLFAEEHAGRWIHIEYVFTLGSRLFELRWSEGRAPRLWSMNRTLRDIELDMLVCNPRQRELTFPVEELQQIELVMQDVPQSLCSTLMRLVSEAAVAERPLLPRAVEPPVERRRVARD